MQNNIETIAINAITDEFDLFISSCIDEQGKPKQPSMRDLMRARGCLPARCANTLHKEKK
jgi:hypothetical protein